MLDTVFGLPVHPLIVHATVVLVPLAALSVLLSALWPRFRAWAGWGPAALSVVALALTPLSTSSGEELEHRLGRNQLIEEHAQLGDLLLWAVLPLALLAVATWWLRRSGRLTDTRRGLGAVLKVLSVLAAVGTLVVVALIGHSGAKAAWSDVGSSAPPVSATLSR